LDGWSGARVFGMVRSANDSHELAAHGFTHVPWTAPYVARSDLMKELELIQETWPAHGTAPQTFVYPRNQVAEVELLERKSFAGFRLGSQQRTRVSRLLMEFNLWSSPEYPHLQKRDIVEIPGGFFLNRRSGVRRLVPMQVTVTRWRRLIDKAIRTGGIVHLWTHPEDFIIGSDQLDLFSEVMEIISSARRSGDLIVQTQAEFCRIQHRDALDQTSTP